MTKVENDVARPPQKSPAGGTPTKPKPPTTPKPKTPTPPKHPKPTPEHKKSNGTVKSHSNLHGSTTSSLLDPERNLWEEAWMSVEVGDANRKRLTLKWHNKNITRMGKLPKEYVENVTELTKSKLAVCQERWPSKTAYDRSLSILKSAMAVKALGDVVVKFDPTGYAASAWAVVSFGLTLVQNTQERMQRTLEASQYLAVLLARYSRIEAHYHRVHLNNAKELGDAIVKVYIDRVVQSFKSLTDEPLKALKSAIENDDRTVDKWYRQLMAEQQQLMLESQEEEMQRVKEVQNMLITVSHHASLIMHDVAKIDMTLSTEIRTQLLEWLFPSGKDAPSESKHRKLRSAIVTKQGRHTAGKWLLQRQDYQDWVNHPQSLLWLYGESGCGKSSLCSTIIEQLEPLFKKDRDRILLRWYFRFDKPDTMSIDLLLRFFLRQLGSSVGGFPEDISGPLEEDRRFARYPDTKVLIEYLHDTLSALEFQKDVFIVLDGLDEFPTQSKEQNRPELLNLIRRLGVSGLSNLHILLVSKNEEDIRECLRGRLKDLLVQIDVTEGLDVDINNYIDTIMRQGEGIGDLDESLKSLIRARLTQGTERYQPTARGYSPDWLTVYRNFLWVTSLIQELRDCRKDPNKIEEKLQTVPTSMVAIYEKHLSSVKEGDERYLKLIFVWLLRQLRPLTQEEIAAAAGLHDVDAVYDICTGRWVTQSTQTVSINRQLQTYETVLQFTHFSAKEYLEAQLRLGSQSPIWRFLCAQGEAHIQIVQRCLDVLMQPRETEETSGKNGIDSKLRRYAAEYWFEHYRLVEKTEGLEAERSSLQQRVIQLFQSSDSFGAWLDCFDPDRQTTPVEDPTKGSQHHRRKRRASPVYYALRLRLKSIAEDLAKADPKDLSIRGEKGETTLQLAVYQGYRTVTKALLKHNVDINAEQGQHGTALYVAAARGHASIAEVLINAKARVTGTVEGALGNALHVAAYKGYDSVVSLLLAGRESTSKQSRGVPVDHLAGFFGTALVAASAAGKEPMVQMLLERGADPNVVGGRLGTALQAAWNAQPRPKGVIAALKARGAKYQTNESNPWTTAYRRIEKGDKDIIRTYQKLFLPQQAITKEVSERQKLLVAGLDRWKGLPRLRTMENCQATLAATCNCVVPFNEQLEDIQRLVSGLTVAEEDWRNEDLLYKAMFWAGVSYILENMGPLVLKCMDRVIDESQSPKMRSNKETSQFPQVLIAGLPRDVTRRLNPAGLSDLVAIDLGRQRTRTDDRNLEEQESEPRRAGLTPGYLAASDLMSLLKDVIRFANKCTQYHRLAGREGYEIPHWTRIAIEDLTFEVFLIVMRLATIREWNHQSIVFQQTISSLMTVRMPRLLDLDTACWKELTLAGTLAHPESSPDRADQSSEAAKKLQDVIVGQIANVQTGLSDQLDAFQTRLISDIQSRLSILIGEEVSRAVKQIQPTEVVDAPGEGSE
ncbi:hypothetical protein BO78DRAFT_410609 [Aspergillus sclerotiicarbonarius CBS 121057]|uniref:NACHT domain-containing protein n=1 Tax=Aspergillus sclerotiicarbonarius (strain CBS 121057 / IBT 28362) TaxID=1448318 RepID=A0A319ENX3_ASPSB|nr:hypothetical protein BO78DRAFT_410609 [Aspergillus sclerotiicarbonarius CBS 121057]